MKKLDNKGWGLLMFFGFMLIFTIALFMIVYMTNEFEDGLTSSSNKKISYSQYETYKGYERAVKKAAESYAKVNGFVDYINIGELKIESSIKSSCVGYAMLNSTQSGYTSYLKCGNYKTEGFSEEFIK